MEKKQTAVEWLLEQVQQQRETGETDLRTTIFYCRQALQMEKEQMEVCNNIVKYKFDIGFTLEDIKYAFESGQKNPNLKFEDILDNGSEKN